MESRTPFQQLLVKKNAFFAENEKKKKDAIKLANEFQKLARKILVASTEKPSTEFVVNDYRDSIACLKHAIEILKATQPTNLDLKKDDLINFCIAHTLIKLSITNFNFEIQILKNRAPDQSNMFTYAEELHHYISGNTVARLINHPNLIKMIDDYFSSAAAFYRKNNDYMTASHCTQFAIDACRRFEQERNKAMHEEKIPTVKISSTLFILRNEPITKALPRSSIPDITETILDNETILEQQVCQLNLLGCFNKIHHIDKKFNKLFSSWLLQMQKLHSQRPSFFIDPSRVLALKENKETQDFLRNGIISMELLAKRILTLTNQLPLASLEDYVDSFNQLKELRIIKKYALLKMYLAMNNLDTLANTYQCILDTFLFKQGAACLETLGFNALFIPIKNVQPQDIIEIDHKIQNSHWHDFFFPPDTNDIANPTPQNHNFPSVR